MSSRLVVAGYLAAIVAANLSLAHFGARAAIYNAFFFIGFDLVARDRLHDSWRGPRLWPRMLALIAVGGVVSYLASLLTTPDELDVARIAFASSIAFLSAAISDAVAYHLLRNRPWYERANQSNVLSSAVDSVVFIWIAIGFSWQIVFGLFCAKVAGGVVWSFLFSRYAEGRAWLGRNREQHPARPTYVK